MSETAIKQDNQQDWQFLPIKDFAHTTSGGTPKRGIEEYYNGDVPWVKSGDLNDSQLNSVDEFITQLGLEKSSAKLFKPGTLLIALYGATIGRLSILNFEAASNQAVCGITLPENMDVKYVFYYLLSIRRKLISQGKGGAQPNINQQIVKETIIPVAPSEQQKRIVAKIEELFSHIDAGIEALKKAKQLLKQYRQSVLKAAVTGELTKEWREANKDKLEPASKLLERILKERREKWEEQQLEQFKAKGEMPKDDKWKAKYKVPEVLGINEIDLTDGWVACTFEQLITELKNGISKKPTEEKGLAIFRISAVRPMFVNKEDVRYLPNDFNSTGFDIENGDLLFTRYNGNPEFVGVCGKVKGLQRKTVYPDKIMRARLVSNSSLSSDYLELSLNCGISKAFIRSVTKTTAGQSGVAGGDVKKCPVVLPCFAEQQKIAEIVDEKTSAIIHLQDAVDFQLKKAEQNKQSILASAFSGKFHE